MLWHSEAILKCLLNSFCQSENIQLECLNLAHFGTITHVTLTVFGGLRAFRLSVPTDRSDRWTEKAKVTLEDDETHRNFSSMFLGAKSSWLGEPHPGPPGKRNLDNDGLMWVNRGLYPGETAAGQQPEPQQKGLTRDKGSANIYSPWPWIRQLITSTGTEAKKIWSNVGCLQSSSCFQKSTVTDIWRFQEGRVTTDVPLCPPRAK